MTVISMVYGDGDYTVVVIRYAITDGIRFGADAEARLAGLQGDAERWVELGIDFVQLREKYLEAGELLRVAVVMQTIFRERGGKTRLLVNGRADVAVAAGADGVHLTSAAAELTPGQVWDLYRRADLGDPIVSVSCHSAEDAARACRRHAEMLLFGPVFEKRVGGAVVTAGVGLEALRHVCAAAAPIPVLALGGVDMENAAVCLEAGAAGVAGIRLFADCE